jgi:hypothetical protein
MLTCRFIILTVISLAGFFNSFESNWELELEKEGIKVYTRHVEDSSFKEFRGEMDMTGNISEIASEICDVEKYPEWCYKTELVRVIKKEGNSIRYFYVSETPGFLKTRVAYFESKKDIDPKTNEVTISLNNFQSGETIPESSLLIPIMKGYWKLTPKGENSVHVTMQMLTDPGGIIPAWLANLVVVDSPFVTFKNLRERVSKKIKIEK